MKQKSCSAFKIIIFSFCFFVNSKNFVFSTENNNYELQKNTQTVQKSKQFATNYSTLSANDLIFESVKFALTGKSGYKGIDQFAVLSRQTAKFLLLPFFDIAQKKIIYFGEIFFPENKDFFYQNIFLTEQEWQEIKKNIMLSFVEIDESQTLLESLENNTFETEEIPKEIIQEILYRKNDGSLRKFSYGEEQFSLSNNNQNIIFTNVRNNFVIRKFFDENLILLKTQVYNNPKLQKDFTLLKQTDYFYDEKFLKVQKQTEENFQSNTRTEKFFDDSTLLTMQIKSHYEKQEEIEEQNTEKSEEKKLVTDEIQKFNYNSENKITEKHLETFFTKKDLNGKEEIIKNSQQEKFIYHEYSKNPDILYFENGVLRRKTVYKDDSNYSVTVYFDTNHSVVTDYKDDLKILEVFYFNDSELRRNSFEKQ